ADIERRHDREQMAADVGRDVVRSELALDQLHGGEDRPFGTPGAEARRTRRHDLGERAGVLLFQGRGSVGGARAPAPPLGIPLPPRTRRWPRPSRGGCIPPPWGTGPCPTAASGCPPAA